MLAVNCFGNKNGFNSVSHTLPSFAKLQRLLIYFLITTVLQRIFTALQKCGFYFEITV